MYEIKTENDYDDFSGDKKWFKQISHRKNKR